MSHNIVNLITNEVDCPSPCKVQHVHPLPETGRDKAAVPRAGVVLLKRVVQIVTEAIWRQAIAVVRPDNPGNDWMDNTLQGAIKGKISINTVKIRDILQGRGTYTYDKCTDKGSRDP